MRFSVVIPCHNAERWISQTLETVAAQTFKPHEIIIVNDNSTDDSDKVIADSSLDVKLLHTTHGNAGAARNSGIEVATGDWIALLDADDLWYPHHLQQAAALLKDCDAVAYCAHHDFMELDGTRVPLPGAYWQGYSESRTGLTQDNYVDLMAQQFHFGHSTVIYRLDRLREVGAFDLSQVRRHDVDLWLRMIDKHTWAWAKQPAASYRYLTPGSISRNTVEVAYYALRALTKNAPRYPQPKYRRIIDSYARRALSVSFHDADPKMRQKLRELAWPLVPTSYRLFYKTAALCPALFRAGVWMKRNTWNAVRRRLRHKREAANLEASQV